MQFVGRHFEHGASPTAPVPGLSGEDCPHHLPLHHHPHDRVRKPSRHGRSL